MDINTCIYILHIKYTMNIVGSCWLPYIHHPNHLSKAAVRHTSPVGVAFLRSHELTQLFFQGNTVI